MFKLIYIYKTEKGECWGRFRACKYVGIYTLETCTCIENVYEKKEKEMFKFNTKQQSQFWFEIV